jgi:hypothetical protein
MLLNRARHAALVGALTCATIGAPLRAQAADPPPRACFDAAEQGQALRDQAKLRDARDAFRMCAAATCPALVQRDCAGWLQDVENRIPSLIVTASDPSGNQLIDVSVSVDGKPFATKLDGVSQPVDPGVHVFHFEARDAEPLEQQLVIRDGEKYQKLNVVLKPRAPSSSSSTPNFDTPSHGNGFRTAAIISAGVGVVALGAFTYFGISGVSDDVHDDHTCAPRCSNADSVRNELKFADIALGVTVVAAALTVFFYVESRSHGARTTTAAATSSVEPQPSFSFTGTGFRF